MKNLISKILPRALKEKIKTLNCFKRWQAIQLASSSKRIDICAAQFAHALHLSKHTSLEGKVCLEVGAGWVLSHALVCYLLGAKKVIATDIVPLAQPEAMFFALKNAVMSVPRDILAPFSDHSRVRERLIRLSSIRDFSFEKLKEIGIEYRSPVDLAKEKLNIPVDFIYSFSVLEHVPSDDISALLSNLMDGLNHGGAMIHCIHLEDHEDIEQHPFDFLKIPGNQFSRELQSSRGNRIRQSGWKRIFGELKGAKSDLIYAYSRLDKAVPEAIDSTNSFCDKNDLVVSHIGIYTQKNG